MRSRNDTGVRVGGGRAGVQRTPDGPYGPELEEPEDPPEELAQALERAEGRPEAHGLQGASGMSGKFEKLARIHTTLALVVREHKVRITTEEEWHG